MIEIKSKETGETLARINGDSLAGADLRELNLAGADLRRQDLSGANFWHSDLTDADLSGACLKQARLQGGQFQGANLNNTDLTSARIGAHSRSGAAVLNNARLKNANLAGAQRGIEILIDMHSDIGKLNIHVCPPRQRA